MADGIVEQVAQHDGHTDRLGRQHAVLVFSLQHQFNLVCLRMGRLIGHHLARQRGQLHRLPVLLTAAFNARQLQQLIQHARGALALPRNLGTG